MRPSIRKVSMCRLLLPLDGQVASNPSTNTLAVSGVHSWSTRFEEEQTRLRDQRCNDATTRVPTNPVQLFPWPRCHHPCLQELDFTVTSDLISDVVIAEEEPGEQLEEAVIVIDLTMGHNKLVNQVNQLND